MKSAFRESIDQAVHVVKTGTDLKGQHFNTEGCLNQAAWLGERMPHVLKTLDQGTDLLRKAQATFERYAAIHREKGTKAGNQKAKENQDLADEIARYFKENSILDRA